MTVTTETIPRAGRARRRAAAGLAAAVAAALLAAGCTGGGAASRGEEAKPAEDPSKVSGTITVLTQRTDWVQDGTMARYADEFRKTYPKVTVKFDGITDYEGEVKIRMNTKNYGDVLLIPGAIKKNDYPRFFASLGSRAERAEKYRFTDYSTVDGKVYGQSPIGVVPGFLYNKKVWAEAGATEWPTTPAAFLDALRAIRAKTSAVPYYTNFKDMWPLTSWTYALGSVSCDAQAQNRLTTTDPWAKGSELRTVDTLLYDIVHGKLIEKDPSTTNWEASKPRLAKGEIATMWLGSWAIPQFRDAAEKAGTDPGDIGFMPFPAQVDGAFCAVASPDYQLAVNVHSPRKEAARAWVDWFTEKSGYAADNLALSPLKDAALPAVLKPYTDRGVNFIELDQKDRALVNEIDNAAEVGLEKPEYRQKLVDVARGAAQGDLDGYLGGLSERWTRAEKSAGAR
ncbi:extracellular solute-binding protein [Streptomyces sp. NPDC093085]|uniref:ABC transporter substrate-binding protein n=1 Tax=Streptomyces sp. NPDC093085 TaxID=3155068 RepID=UPI00341CB501